MWIRLKYISALRRGERCLFWYLINLPLCWAFRNSQSRDTNSPNRDVLRKYYIHTVLQYWFVTTRCQYKSELVVS